MLDQLTLVVEPELAALPMGAEVVVGATHVRVQLANVRPGKLAKGTFQVFMCEHSVNLKQNLLDIHCH